MNKYLNIFQNIDKQNHDDNYIMNNGASNILFIGGCRCYVLSIYFKKICEIIPWFAHAQYGISVIGVHIVDLYKRDKTSNLTNTIENADIIMCECIKHYSFLNTINTCEQNIYNNFNLKKGCKIIMIPNLELRYYVNDILKNTEEDFIIEQNKNLTKILDNCKKLNCIELSDYIEENIKKIRLFATHNHPTYYLFNILFKEMINNTFNYVLEDNIIEQLKEIKIFEIDANSTKIIELDYKLGLDRSII